MIDLSGIKDTLSEFSPKDFARKKPFAFASILILIVLFIAGLFVLLIQTSPDKKEEVIQENFEADSPLLIPDSLEIEKDYYPSRITENQWSKAEIDKWFTYPDEDAMKNLSKSNDETVKNILEAAP